MYQLRRPAGERHARRRRLPHAEYLDTDSATFATYLKVRASRHDDFTSAPRRVT
jgi:hypothetical protein